jgi:xanthine/CO dehydrogenase XdhC/CoxF family maturation factor
MGIERSIIDAAARLRRRCEPHLVATVVRVRGAGGYRKPGARILLTHFRWISGSVSGGSLEDDIASKGWSRTRDGEPVVLTYDTRTQAGLDDDIRAAFGLGADGAVDVMLERAGIPGKLDPLELAERCLNKQRRGAIVTVIRSEVPGIKTGARVAVIARPGDAGEAEGDTLEASLRAGMLADARAAIVTGESCHRTYRSDLGNVDVFVEAILPPPRLFIFGTGHDAVPLVTLAKSLGWDAIICADEAREATRQRFTMVDEILVGTPDEIAARIDACDRAAAVVMGHEYDIDRANLGLLIRSHCRYIGVLGSKTRTQRMICELDLGIHADTRVHMPAGLEIGAETPQELALAIASEVQALLSHAPAARSTRTRVAQIEERAPLMPLIAEAVAAAVPVSPITGTHRRVTDAVPLVVAS